MLVDNGLTVIEFEFCPVIWFEAVHAGAAVPAATYQAYAYGLVPPETFAVRETLLPWFITGLDGDICPAVIPWIIVMVPDFMLFAVSGVVAESVTITFAWTVLPISTLGIAQAKLFVDSAFVRRMFAITVPVIVLVIR